MKPRRKLLTTKALALLIAEIERGVPIRRALLNLNLAISVPTAKQLLTLNELKHPNMSPQWLDQEGPDLQECPVEWRFKGFFPTQGEWLCTKQ